MDAIIQMQKVVKKFGNKEVLKGVDLEIPAGSVTGLLGKNGSGKTTLMKCALGLLKPQEGTIKIFGEGAWDLSESAKAKLGYVPQQASFMNWMKVGDTIDYTASFYPNWNTKLVDQLVNDWELNRKDLAMKLSEGQKQKLSIILALGHEPALLILDEPVASLDPIARRQFLKTVFDIIADRECTILFSSHITSDLERVADRAAILNDGKIFFNGEVDSLKDTVKLLKITFLGDVPQAWDMPGIMRVKSSGKDALVHVKDYNESVKRQMEQKWNARVETADLNLEDIFVEMIQ